MPRVAWDALMRRVRRLDGNVIISHEILAPAQPSVIERAMSDLAGSEVHVVYSARDLARQIAAAWQESVKQGRVWTSASTSAARGWASPFMMLAFAHPPTCCRRGPVAVPPERIHLVVVPARRYDGADLVDTLWTRMCQALEIDPAWAPVDSAATNASLGIAETQVLRRLNQALGRKVAREGEYDGPAAPDGRRRHPLPKAVRAGHAAARRLRLGRGAHRRSLDWIVASGIDVIGDLDDLRAASDPDRAGNGRWAATPQAAITPQSMTAEAAAPTRARRTTRELERRQP